MQIISLAYVVEKLKDDNLNISKSFKSLPPGKVKGKGKGKVKGNDQGKKPPGKQSQFVKGKDERKNQEQKYGEANTKKVNYKTCFWCPTHQVWTIHRTEECRLKAESKPSHNTNQQNTYTKPLTSALATILLDINSEENE